MALFQHNIVEHYIATFNPQKVAQAYEVYKAYFLNPEIQKNIRQSNEVQFQEGFLRELFVNVLGYTISPSPNFNLIREEKNETDSKKADGAILINNEVVGVIELKGCNTTDLKKVEAQAFGYKNQHAKATYVIISNFEKLRFYIDNSVDFEEFNLFNLSEDEFSLLYLCLAHENIEKNLPKTIKTKSVSKEEEITNKLYKDYSEFKQVLFNDILALNHVDTAEQKLVLFRKTQKLLDRLLFIFFAEDSGLLSPNTMKSNILDLWFNRSDYETEEPLYNRIKKYFTWLNEGFKGRNFEVFAYNGGLFKPDEVLDNLTISDDILYKYTLKLSEYNYASEVDVNILGHIFEHSLTEIEEVTNSLLGNEQPTVSKRKKDGVFYTPQYITKYIVENTVGKLCTEKKAEMEIDEEEYFSDKKRYITTKRVLLDKLNSYREWLLGISICDPACGSGAFLNAALQFLINEHKLIDEMQAKITGDAIVFPNIENVILENNLYGVDINEESVEIAKLALWLRTAQPYRKLSSLNNNIKCGNSLISDVEVAGDKAFDWEAEFPQVFEKGGFDVVIGNPPYVDIKQMDKETVSELFKIYKTAENRINLYSIFIEKGVSLLKHGGQMSFINPNSMLVNSSYTELRKLIVNDISFIVKLPDNVFADAKVETIIWGLSKGNKDKCFYALVYNKKQQINQIDTFFTKEISKGDCMLGERCTFNIYGNAAVDNILKKIEKSTVSLNSVAEFSLGITPYDKYKGHSKEIIDSRAFHSSSQLDSTYKPLITGENITRYYVSPKPQEYIKYGEWLGAPRDERFFTYPRVIVRQIVSGNPLRIFAGYTEAPLYFTQIGFGIIPNAEIEVKYLTSLLNSRLINFYHAYKYLDMEKELFQKILIANCKKFPIKVVGKDIQSLFNVQVDLIICSCQKLNELRNKFLRILQTNFETIKITSVLQVFDEREFSDFISELRKQKIVLSLKQQDEWEEYFNDYKRQCNELSAQISSTDKEIDRMVYALYDLTDEEIAIVEDHITHIH
ncbi:MAG: N-6 DNA methylase [Alistipes sp.]|nr:N-6 DNA methylase [Alistipes sp.]